MNDKSGIDKVVYNIPSNRARLLDYENITFIDPEDLSQTSRKTYVYEIRHNLNTYEIFGSVYCENSNVVPFSIELVDKNTIHVRVPSEGSYEVVLVY